MNKDSTEETLAHIGRVQGLLADIQVELGERALRHDRSKLEEPEKTAFDEVTGALHGLTYGSPEYKTQLEKLKSALAHHYANNSHHPEHYPGGIAEMTLLDLVEMMCDWKAATERHADGSLKRSIEINRERFGMSDQLAAILENSRKEMLW